jgi:uncharacterized membrane protein (UPF0127 family)
VQRRQLNSIENTFSLSFTVKFIKKFQKIILDVVFISYKNEIYPIITNILQEIAENHRLTFVSREN